MKSLIPPAGAAVLACAALVLAGCTSTTSGQAQAAKGAGATGIAAGTTTGQPTTSRPPTSRPAPASTTESVSVFDITIGDCLAEDMFADSGGENIVVEGEQQVVDCGQPHHYEVFASKILPGTAYPGESELTGTSTDYCTDEFEWFVGVPLDDSTLGFTYLAPTANSWRSGDRELTCLVGDFNGTVTGTLRGARR